jgi:outer membrane protein assembly factor BamA
LKPSLSLSGLNDLGVGPAVTWVGFPTADATLDVVGTWFTTDHRHIRLSETFRDRRPVSLRLRAVYDHKPDRRYFGIGNGTPATDISYYELSNNNIEVALLLGASPLRQLRITGGFSGMSPSNGYNAQPLLQDVFAPGSVPYEHQMTQDLWYGVGGDLARLDDDRDPSRGVHGRVDLRRAMGLRSVDPDYYQWRVEGRAYLPVFAKRRVIAMRGVYTGVDPTGGAATALPFYRLVESDLTSRFAGYDTGRFHDRQLMLARIEYRWQILYRMSALALYEAGEVAPRTSSFNLPGVHVSYGVGLRLGLSDEATLRGELAKSVEGLHAVLALGSDF